MKRLVIILNILFSVVGFFSIGLALTSFMVFDSPGSENNPYLWVAFYSALALPITCLVSVILSVSILRHSQNYKKALWVSLLPCIVIATLCGSLILIQIYCNGDFACGK
jgi:hypothetical protein